MDGWDFKALEQDRDDLVDRMEIAYKDSPHRAASVMVNALGIIIARAEDACGGGDDVCLSCIMMRCAASNMKMIEAAIQEAHKIVRGQAQDGR